MKKILLIMIAVGLGSTLARADEAPVFPKAITSMLETEYPGWNLAPISKMLIPLDARDKYSNILHRDLDGDGVADYALTLNYIDSTNNVKTAAIVFVARQNDFKEYTLSEMWLGPDHRLVFAPGDTVLHWVRKGDKGYQSKEDEDSNLKAQTPVPVYTTDAIEVINVGKAVTAFYWDGNGFQHIRKNSRSEL